MGVPPRGGPAPRLPLARDPGSPEAAKVRPSADVGFSREGETCAQGRSAEPAAETEALFEAGDQATVSRDPPCLAPSQQRLEAAGGPGVRHHTHAGGDHGDVCVLHRSKNNQSFLKREVALQCGRGPAGKIRPRVRGTA